MHVADAFDAMTSARAYRSGRIPVEAIAELESGLRAGNPYANDVVKAARQAEAQLAHGLVAGELLEEADGD